MYQRILNLVEPKLGPDSPIVAGLLFNIAEMKVAKGEADTAIEMLEKALPIVETNKTADGYGSRLAAIFLYLGMGYDARHDSEKARAYLERSLEIREELSGLTSQECLTIIKLLAQLRDRGTERQARDPSSTSQRHAEQLCQQALGIFQAGKFKDADAVAKQAVVASKLSFGVISTNFAHSLLILAGTCKALGDTTNALALCETGLTINVGVLGPEHLDVATSLFALATLHDDLGNYGSALELARLCLEIREKALPPDDRDLGCILVVLSSIYARIGDHKKSLEIAGRALPICDKHFKTDPFTAISCLSQIALNSSRLDQHEAALKLYQLVAALYEKVCGPDHPSVATAFGNIAAGYRDLGNLPEALNYYRRSQEIREKALGKDHPDSAMTFGGLGSVYSQQGNFPMAVESYRRALSILEKTRGPTHPTVAVTLNNFALCYEDQGDYSKAVELLTRALKIQEMVLGKDHPEVASTASNLAAALRRLGRFNEALEYYKRSLAIINVKSGAELRHAIPVLFSIADLHFEHGDFWSAITHANQALLLQREEALAYYASSSDNEALTRAEQCAFGSSLFHAACSRATDTDALNANLLGAERAAFNKALLEEVRVVQAALEADPDTATGDLRAQRQALHAQRSHLWQIDINPTERDAQVKALERDLKQIDARLADRQRPINERLFERELKLKDIAQRLPGQAALVDITRYQRRDLGSVTNQWKELRYVAYVTFPLAKDSTNVHVERVELGEVAPIDAAMFELRRLISAGQVAPKRLQPITRQLYDLVYGPLAKHLSSVSHLIICPDGQLGRLPFEMLSRDGRFLIEDKTVSYVGSGREIAQLGMVSRKTPTSAPFVLGNPDFDLALATPKPPLETNVNLWASVPVSGAANSLSRSFRAGRFQSLPNAANEACLVAQILGDDCILRLGRDARESDLKAVQSPRVLHLATHGFFLPDQEVKLPAAALSGFRFDDRPFDRRVDAWESPLVRCGLALAGANHSMQLTNSVEDGLLTGQEAALLNLQGTELVILSACDTGTGEVKIGEGVMSLRHAFRIAGAETVLASHWPVSDLATRLLMTEFIRRWRSGEPRAKAWREAQLSLLRNKDLSSPYFWAAFTLTGQWD